MKTSKLTAVEYKVTRIDGRGNMYGKVIGKSFPSETFLGHTESFTLGTKVGNVISLTEVI